VISSDYERCDPHVQEHRLGAKAAADRERARRRSRQLLLASGRSHAAWDKELPAPSRLPDVVRLLKVARQNSMEFILPQP
jgi:hypothetical protein